MSNIRNHVAGLALLGTLLTGCSDSNAASSDVAKELQDASDAFANWSEMKADQFVATSKRALAETESQIESLRNQIENSEAAEGARETLADLEKRRDELAQKMSELADATGDKLKSAQEAVVDGFADVGTRIRNAWKELTKG